MVTTDFACSDWTVFDAFESHGFVLLKGRDVMSGHTTTIEISQRDARELGAWLTRNYGKAGE